MMIRLYEPEAAQLCSFILGGTSLVQIDIARGHSLLAPFAVEVQPRSCPNDNEILTGARSSRVFTREADATLIQSLRAQFVDRGRMQ